MPYSNEATQFFERLSNEPTAARKDVYAACIDALVAAGIWAKLDALYLFAAAHAATARTNLKSSSFSATEVNSPTFTADQGYAGDGSTSVVDTNFNPTTASSPKFLQNDAHMGVWVRTSRAGAVAPDIGNASNDQGCNIYPFFTDDKAYLRLNDNAEAEGFTVSGSTGLFVANRSSSTARQGYRNGTSIGTYASNTSKAPINANIAVGRGGQNFSTDQIAVASIGGSLTSTEQAAFHDAIAGYLDGLTDGAGSAVGAATVTGAGDGSLKNAVGSAVGAATVLGIPAVSLDMVGLASGLTEVAASGKGATKLTREIVSPGLAVTRTDEIFQ